MKKGVFSVQLYKPLSFDCDFFSCGDNCFSLSSCDRNISLIEGA